MGEDGRGLWETAGDGVVFEKYGTLPYLTWLIPYGKLRKSH